MAIISIRSTAEIFGRSLNIVIKKHFPHASRYLPPKYLCIFIHSTITEQWEKFVKRKTLFQKISDTAAEEHLTRPEQTRSLGNCFSTYTRVCKIPFRTRQVHTSSTSVKILGVLVFYGDFSGVCPRISAYETVYDHEPYIFCR